MGTIKLTIALVMITLFSIAIIGFSIDYAEKNNSAYSISDDEKIAEINARNKANLTEFTEGSEDTYESIISSTVEEGSDVIPSSGPFAITAKNIINVGYNVLELGYNKITGNQNDSDGNNFSIFFTVFLGLIGLAMSFYIYKALRGIPD